ncbi:cysteine hydrolase family protein [Ammoniphilus sp. CFH 90114]|uniref:cysteine hydrolase family protein n=1 Tax=Ammoniphilus sp. CFH 90114 TaxID=2493665 RepID=UPI00100EAA21|nr:isochorismatase family cysteine hydrolase [Ammoniphilus sp. CFH 90114]RXT05754.1 cysteine hydrolase [Ammoniphilus sp. CFH 90114]
MGKKALIVIDVINDFVKNSEGPLFCPSGKMVTRKIKESVAYFHETQQQVIYVHDSHRKNDAEFLLRPLHAISGSWGAELADELKADQEEEDYHILKRRHSAFSYTDLDLFLREEKIEEVVLVGGMTHVSIRSTASDAFYQAYQVTVLSDCCFSQSEELHQSGLQDIGMFATICTFHEFVGMTETER